MTQQLALLQKLRTNTSQHQLPEHLDFEVPYPSTTLRAEYNIIKQIYQINKLHEITASFHWVRGHQDRNKDIDKLPIEAQLNIGADELANEWQEEHYGKYHPIPYVYPTSPAQLIINDHCVTSQYRHQLIQAYTEPQ